MPIICIGGICTRDWVVMDNIIIATENLSFVYNEGDNTISNEALGGINLEIRQGSFTVILGHNGSGKSTLAKHFNAILLPSGGRCLIKGMDTKDENLLFEIRQTVGMVFQNPDNQIIASVVDEDIAFAPENLGLPRDEIVRRVDDSLNAVGMIDYKDHAPHLLSGGQKQRIAIAGVMAMRPECIVLDEPTAMLDPKGRDEVLETILALQRRYNLTVILITHHINEATTADRVVVLNNGCIHMDGIPETVLTDVENLRTVGLDAPPSVRLLYALNNLGADIMLNSLDEETCADRIYNWLQDSRCI